jgi:hypothetical protein
MLNLRQHKDIRLTVRAKTLKLWIAQPNFHSFKIINQDLAMVNLTKSHIKWDKPTYVGFSILEISKLRMYQFHYDIILARYGRNAKLLFTDTDSLCYELRTANFYDDILRDSLHYDTSDYPKDHACYSETNKKVLGKFKDECNGAQPRQFVGLRAKMYSILMPTGVSDKSTAKGIKSSYAKKHLIHGMYYDSLVNRTKTRASFQAISSTNHVLTTAEVRKDALNPFDDKRYILDDGIHTLAYGHYKLEQSSASTL